MSVFYPSLSMSSHLLHTDLIYMDLKILIRSALTKVKVIEKNIFTDNKNKFSGIADKLSKVSEDLNSKKRSLKELKNCFTIVDYINNQLCEVLKTN